MKILAWWRQYAAWRRRKAEARLDRAEARLLEAQRVRVCTRHVLYQPHVGAAYKLVRVNSWHRTSGDHLCDGTVHRRGTPASQPPRSRR